MKLLIVNGSPRAPRSNSRRYAELFQARWKGEARYAALTAKNHAELAAAAADCTDLLLVFPLYADGLPAPLLRFLEFLEGAGPEHRPRISVLINCGFLEPHQNDVAVDMVRLFCLENGYPFGMGLGRQVIDNRGNERSFFLVTFVDSNYRPEPVAGYQWVARWPVAGTGLHVGAGYLAAVSARGDYMWVPFPMPLPVAKIGTDDISFYGTYIPVTNVFFFYSTITIDDAKRRDLPLPATSAWSADRNYLYGGWGWEYMDNGEEFSPSNVKNDSSWHVGMRHYSGRHWATDVSYRRSEHDIKTAGTDTSKSYRFQTWAVQLQYNIDALDSLRLYAGGGLGYSKMKGPAGKDDSFHPVTSLGATYAVTKNVFVNAEMFTSFARYKGTVEARGDDYVLKPMATDFTLSLGVAF